MAAECSNVFVHTSVTAQWARKPEWFIRGDRRAIGGHRRFPPLLY
jgi:hypothetical protein